jgi:hypothetical protein
MIFMSNSENLKTITPACTEKKEIKRIIVPCFKLRTKWPPDKKFTFLETTF